eukprot:15154758-Alexandrium_andersonii.AAC.1
MQLLLGSGSGQVSFSGTYVAGAAAPGRVPIQGGGLGGRLLLLPGPRFRCCVCAYVGARRR